MCRPRATWEHLILTLRASDFFAMPTVFIHCHRVFRDNFQRSLLDGICWTTVGMDEQDFRVMQRSKWPAWPSHLRLTVNKVRISARTISKEEKSGGNWKLEQLSLLWALGRRPARRICLAWPNHFPLTHIQTLACGTQTANQLNGKQARKMGSSPNNPTGKCEVKRDNWHSESNRTQFTESALCVPDTLQCYRKHSRPSFKSIWSFLYTNENLSNTCNKA